MSRAACSPLIKRSFTKQSTYRFGSMCSKIMDENRESKIDDIDIEDAWYRLNIEQEYQTQDDLNKMIEQFGQLKYFKTIIEDGSIDCLKYALSQAKPIQTFADEILFRQGTQSDNMYILLEGKVNIFYIPYMENLHQAEHESQENLKKKNLLLRTVRVGEAIGNLNLYYGKSYKNMAICAESCKFISISNNAYKRSLIQADKIQAEQGLDFLRSVNIFSHWTDDKLIEILLQSTLEKVNCYSVIYNQNQKSTDFFIINSGQYGVYQRKADDWKTGTSPSSQFNEHNEQNQYQRKELTNSDKISSQFNLIYIHEYGPLNHFGHQDIMDNKKRNQFVVCKSREGGELIRIKSSIFIQLVLSDPTTAKLLLQEKIDDQIFLNPQKKLHNFQSYLQKTDIDKSYKQLKKEKNFQSIDLSSITQNNIPNQSIISNSQKIDKTTNHIHSNIFKSSIISTDVPLDSPSSTSHITNRTQSQVKIQSRNAFLPQIKVPERLLSTSSLISAHSKCKQRQQHSPTISNLPSNNQIPSLIHLESQTPISSKKSPLLKRIRQESKSVQFNQNIFLNDHFLLKQKISQDPYRLQDVY